MNLQLIDQFLHKAGARFGGEGIDYSDFTSSKFAELIVREVFTVIENEQYEIYEPVIQKVKQHFGVEE